MTGDDEGADSGADELTLDAPTTARPPGSSHRGVSDETLAEVQSSGSTTDVGLGTVPRDLYLVEGEIARGGMGRVLAARDRRLGRPVALKELLSFSPDLARRFEREALLTARLQHPSIVNVHEAGRWPSGEPFYSMKRVMGRPLDRVLAETKSLEGRLALLPNVVAVAQALAYAHEQGVIHRDLKPANVLVGGFGETVVIDWGLAKDLLREESTEAREPHAPLPDADGLTAVGAVLGTPAFMPPEQARGEGVDERSDVYSLGAILYTVLAGRPPYAGPSSIAVLNEVLKGAPPPLETRQPGLPEDLLAIVRKAMSPEPAERYRTARALAEDLQRFATGQLVGAHRYRPAQLFRRWVRKHRGVVFATAAGILALTIGGALAVQRIRAERDVAVWERATAQARNDELVLEKARGSLETDPTATIAWLEHYSETAPKWAAARMMAADARARGVAFRVLAGHEGEVRAIAFSPDGKSLASVGIDQVLRLWDLESGAGRELARGRWHLSTVAFSPDGRRVAVGEDLARIGIWDVASGEGRFVEGLDARKALSFSADGKDLVFAGDADENARWSIETGRYVHRTPSSGGTDFAVVSADRRRAATSAAGTIRVFDLAQGTSTVLASRAATPRAWSFCGPGDSLAVWTGGSLDLFDLGSGRKRSLPAGGGKGVSLACSLDGRSVAAGNEDWSVTIWNLTRAEVRTLKGHHGPVSTVEFSPDGRALASSDDARRLLLWDVEVGRARPLLGLAQEASAWPWPSRGPIAFSRDGVLAAAARSIRLWRLGDEGTWTIRGPNRGQADRVAAPCPTGNCIATGGGAPGIRMWDLAQRSVRELGGRDGGVAALAFDPRRGRTLAVATWDATAYLWDLDAGERRVLPHDGARVDLSGGMMPTEGHFAILAFSPDGSILASGGWGREGARLSFLPGGRSQLLSGNRLGIGQLSFSPDGRWLASASSPLVYRDRSIKDKIVNLWNVATGERRTLAGHDDSVFAVAFSPDGRTFASGSLDHTIRLWDLATGASRVLRGHRDNVLRVAFTADGSRLLSQSNDGTARLWDVQSGREVARVQKWSMEAPAFLTDGTLALSDQLWELRTLESRPLLPADTVGMLAVLPDGHTLARSTEMGDLRVWRDDLPRGPSALRKWLRAATNLKVLVGEADAPSPQAEGAASSR